MVSFSASLRHFNSGNNNNEKFPLITGALGNNALKEKQKLVCLHNISYSLLYEEIIKEAAQI